MRGGSSPEEVAASYLSAMRSGNTAAVGLLTHRDHPLDVGIDERVARYRALGDAAITYEVVPHSVASYIMGVRFTAEGKVVDEIALELFSSRFSPAGRWYLVFFPTRD